MLASLSNSTKKQYVSPIRIWWKFCNQNKLDIYSPTRETVIQFLAEQFQAGASYSTLNSSRCAISLISTEKIGEDKEISRLLKGAFKIRPAKTKYETTWDVNLVLSYLKNLGPNNNLNLKNLSEKKIMLLALSTAHRVQTFSKIEINNIRETGTGIEIKIPDLIKTSGPGRYQPLLILPRMENSLIVCPCTTVLEYLKITKNLRKNCKKLFIATNNPHKAVGSQTLSKWIKSVLSKSGIDTSIFTGHSVRHAASSAAKLRGIDIRTINRTASWTKESKMFANYYNKPIMNNIDDFANAVINNV